MKRRRLLLGAGTVPFAGCSFLNDGSERGEGSAHEVFVINRTENSQEVGVIIEGETETLFNHQFELDVGKAGEGWGYYGDATKIVAILNEEKEFQFTYNPSLTCSQSSTLGIVLRIISDDEVELGYDCTTEYDPYTTNGEATRPG